MSWETTKFSSLYAIESRNGLTKPSRVRGGGYKMINMGELFSYDRIYDIPMELVPLNDREKASSKVEPGDLLFARQSLVLEGAGKCSIVMDVSPLTVFESHLIRVRLDQTKANPLFFYYYFKSPQSPIKSIVSQCAQSGIRGSNLGELSVALPALKIQNKIADILSAYDDLIENNQKQIKLLEEAAQRLYKEWFVDLRFPGYENTPIIDGVPQGWKEGMIQDIVIYHDKKRKPLSGMQRAEMQGKYRYYGAASILDYVNNYLFDGTYLLLGEDGTVITEDGYPILQYVTGKFWVNNHAHVLTGKMDYPTEYLYMMFKATKVRDVVTGVAQPKISQARLSNKKTIIPSKEIVRNYCSIVSPVFKQILNLEHQIELHKEARDRLLPKLMSGELEV